MAECSAVGSALRSGRRGRAFESPHSDTLIKGNAINGENRLSRFYYWLILLYLNGEEPF